LLSGKFGDSAETNLMALLSLVRVEGLPSITTFKGNDVLPIHADHAAEAILTKFLAADSTEIIKALDSLDDTSRAKLYTFIEKGDYYVDRHVFDAAPRVGNLRVGDFSSRIQKAILNQGRFDLMEEMEAQIEFSTSVIADMTRHIGGGFFANAADRVVKFLDANSVNPTLNDRVSSQMLADLCQTEGSDDMADYLKALRACFAGFNSVSADDKSFKFFLRVLGAHLEDHTLISGSLVVKAVPAKDAATNYLRELTGKRGSGAEVKRFFDGLFVKPSTLSVSAVNQGLSLDSRSNAKVVYDQFSEKLMPGRTGRGGISNPKARGLVLDIVDLVVNDRSNAATIGDLDYVTIGNVISLRLMTVKGLNVARITSQIKRVAKRLGKSPVSSGRKSPVVSRRSEGLHRSSHRDPVSTRLDPIVLSITSVVPDFFPKVQEETVSPTLKKREKRATNRRVLDAESLFGKKITLKEYGVGRLESAQSRSETSLNMTRLLHASSFHIPEQEKRLPSSLLERRMQSAERKKHEFQRVSPLVVQPTRQMSGARSMRSSSPVSAKDLVLETENETLLRKTQDVLKEMIIGLIQGIVLPSGLRDHALSGSQIMLGSSGRDAVKKAEAQVPGLLNKLIVELANDSTPNDVNRLFKDDNLAEFKLIESFLDRGKALELCQVIGGKSTGKIISHIQKASTPSLSRSRVTKSIRSAPNVVAAADRVQDQVGVILARGAGWQQKLVNLVAVKKLMDQVIEKVQRGQEVAPVEMATLNQQFSKLMGFNAFSQQEAFDFVHVFNKLDGLTKAMSVFYPGGGNFNLFKGVIGRMKEIDADDGFPNPVARQAVQAFLANGTTEDTHLSADLDDDNLRVEHTALVDNDELMVEFYKLADKLNLFEFRMAMRITDVDMGVEHDLTYQQLYPFQAPAIQLQKIAEITAAIGGGGRARGLVAVPPLAQNLVKPVGGVFQAPIVVTPALDADTPRRVTLTLDPLDMIAGVGQIRDSQDYYLDGVTLKRTQFSREAEVLGVSGRLPTTMTVNLTRDYDPVTRALKPFTHTAMTPHYDFNVRGVPQRRHVSAIVIGGGVGGGHFYTLKRDRDGQWFKCNDGRVDLIDPPFQNMGELRNAKGVVLVGDEALSNLQVGRPTPLANQGNTCFQAAALHAIAVGTTVDSAATDNTLQALATHFGEDAGVPDLVAEQGEVMAAAKKYSASRTGQFGRGFNKYGSVGRSRLSKPSTAALTLEDLMNLNIGQAVGHRSTERWVSSGRSVRGHVPKTSGGRQEATYLASLKDGLAGGKRGDVAVELAIHKAFLDDEIDAWTSGGSDRTLKRKDILAWDFSPSGPREKHHDYIQWMFPNPHTSGNNPNAPHVQTIDCISWMSKAESVAYKTKIFENTVNYMKYLGFKWNESSQAFEYDSAMFSKSPKDAGRERRLSGHDKQRFTRMLTCLQNHDLAPVAKAAYEAIIREGRISFDKLSAKNNWAPAVGTTFRG
ncbi:MAG: hypothetical protein ACI9BD_000479, partial [Candidatus Marinamargulisbacteria bacterium]